MLAKSSGTQVQDAIVNKNIQNDNSDQKKKKINLNSSYKLGGVLLTNFNTENVDRGLNYVVKVGHSSALRPHGLMVVKEAVSHRLAIILV